jgi:UDP-GlcNAc:undecaprenyl-phosphate GlcNAc-1-phosphate transferase
VPCLSQGGRVYLRRKFNFMDVTLQYIPIMIVGFAASLGMTPLSRQIAMRLGVVDKPNVPRKTHTDHKPMMGGLAIFVGFVVSLLVFSPPQHLAELGAIVLGTSILAITGLLDDRFDLSWRLRLGVQAISAFMLVLAGIQIHLFNTPLLDIPMTMIWVMALTNALNFLDNMDGLSAGIASIASGWFLLIALTNGQWLVSMLAAALFGAALGFLTYNFNPASTFMGDMGSLTLGYVLATVAIKLQFETQPLGVTWMVPILVLALPVFDITLAVLTRLSEKRSPFEGGRDHTSHRVLALGFSPRMTLFILYSMCIIYGALAFIVATYAPDVAWLVGLGGIVGLLVLFAFMVWVRQTRQK